MKGSSSPLKKLMGIELLNTNKKNRVTELFPDLLHISLPHKRQNFGPCGSESTRVST